MRPFIVGVDQERLAFTVSLAFRRDQEPRSGESFATGYLDDWLIFGFGLSDSSSHFVEVKVEDVLQDHQLCDEVMER
jgi:hypothetical protein